MRWFYLGVVALFATAVLVFLIQNTQSVNISFLSLRTTLPIAIVVLVTYVLGAFTGSSLYALLRRSVQGSRRAPS